MKKNKNIDAFVIIVISLTLIACQAPYEKATKPNVILIMADDIGFECLTINGSTSYRTPVLDSLAENGVNFKRALSQPLCTPSRVKIMTGKYNYKNYEYFTYLNPNQKTFGNLFKENGYKTAVVGKWQLNGIEHKIQGFNDNKRPNHFGFDEYCLWQLTKRKSHGERFANPLIEQNGKFLPRDKDAYGPDIVSDYAIEFIKRNKNNPFFIYYPMLLVHSPFVPTPDTPEWKSMDTRSQKNNRFFIDMVEYMDKLIGKISKELSKQGIAENTLILFVGDNGTNVNLVSQTKNGPVRGGKGNTITHGHHVPMVAYWPKKIKNPNQYDGLINFNDFYATFCDILKVNNESDGKSFMDVLTTNNFLKREITTIYYDPHHRLGSNVSKQRLNISKLRNVFTQNARYKLYKDGRFFDIENDVLETNPLIDEKLDDHQKEIRKKLSIELTNFPELPQRDFLVK